jgi:hypothetical protein
VKGERGKGKGERGEGERKRMVARGKVNGRRRRR